eukprot:GHVU01147715.1.p1 GENE.GHVU01147715.1~~GHVU01147715.1.p1  ORF type:complete len:118 (+),score=16.53 GHVU01147715.1:530-883(+)
MMMMVMMQSAVYTALIVCTHLRLCTIHLSVGLRDRIDDQQRGKQALPKREREREREIERERERERETRAPIRSSKWSAGRSLVSGMTASHESRVSQSVIRKGASRGTRLRAPASSAL